MNERFKTKLGNLFRARFPFVYLTTWEEDRAMQFIQQVANDPALIKTTRAVYQWSVSRGFHSETAPEGDESTRDPIRALEFIERSDLAAIFVILDTEEFCNGLSGNSKASPQVVRRLRDLTDHLRQAHRPKNVVFVSPTVKLPVELEKDVHVLDLHLPTMEEIRQLLNDMIGTNRETGRIKIHLSTEDEERLVKAALGLTIREAENAFAYAMVDDGMLSVKDINVIMEEKCQALRKSDILEFIATDQLSIEDVGGLENLKKWLKKRNNSWLDLAVKKYCLPAPKGMLLTGVPGCGKSLVAKAVASAWQLPLLRLDPGKIYSSLMGSSEENIRKAIKTAEAVAPCILWIDEIEKGFSFSNSHGDSGTSNRVFGSFLTWMAEKTRPVFVIATANDIESLPPELLRKGRFDEIFFVNLPNQTERMAIFYIHLKKRLINPDVVADFKMDSENLARLARKMEGFNGAEIEQVVITALYEAFADNRPITMADLEAAIENTVPLLVTQAEKINAIREWARHRAVYASLPDEPAAIESTVVE